MDDLGALILGKQPQGNQAAPTGAITDELLDSLRMKESSGGKNVYNKESGAAGPYQHIPGTQKMLAKQYGEYDPYNEKQARERTRQYLTDLVVQNKGDVRAALGQYGGFIKQDPTQYVNDVLGGAKQSAPDELGQLILGKAKPTGGLQSTQAQREAVLGPEVTPKEKRETSLAEKAVGALETGATLASGAVSGVAGQLGGLATMLGSEKRFTPEGAKLGAEEAAKIQEAGTYMPRTEAGQRMVKGLGEAFEESKLPPFMPEAAPLAVARPGAAHRGSAADPAQQVLLRRGDQDAA